MLPRGGSTSEHGILSLWGIENKLREDKALPLGLKGSDEKGIPSRARTRATASIGLSIFRDSIFAAGESWAILSNIK